MKKIEAGSVYHVVAPDNLSPIESGRFSFMDGKHLRGKENLTVYRMRCIKVLHRGEVVILRCIDPLGEYSSDKAFVQKYIFLTAEEASEKIKRILRGKISSLKRKLNAEISRLQEQIDSMSPQHVCGLSGFGHSLYDVCPACEEMHARYRKKRK